MINTQNNKGGMRHLIILLLLAVCHSSCIQQNQIKNEVLWHYNGNPEKRRAARYLLKYLSFHYSYDTDTYNEYCQRIKQVWNNEMPVDSMMSQSADLSHHYSQYMKTYNDADIITPDFLIWNIDKSFELWEKSPHLKHLSFDDFCEYVLPYKCLDGQPLTTWKEDWSDKYLGDLPITNQLDCFNMNARKAAEALTYPYRNRFLASPRNVEGFSIIPVLDLETAFLRPYDSCIDNARLGLLNCRSKGVPVSLDFIPNWAYTSGRHYWNSVFATRRRNENYEPFRIKPGDKHFRDNPMAKVYRLTYKPNSKYLKILKSGHQLPSNLQLCSKDVTDEYTRTADISVHIPIKNSAQILHLSVFDNKEWVPVDVAKSFLGRVFFSKVGLGVLYAITQTIDGEEKPVVTPFVLDLRGNQQTFIASDTIFVDITLARKFPSLSHIFNSHRYMHGGMVESSLDSLFSIVVSSASFPDDSIFSCKCKIADTTACRYWRITPSCSQETDIAELFFYDSKGNEVLPLKSSVELIDRDALTYKSITFDDVALVDFGRPVSISEISCIRRGDGNDIIPGDEYELYYWRDRCWKLIGKNTASDIKIDFADIPANGLYFIKDISRGEQNRPFIWNSTINRPEWY